MEFFGDWFIFLWMFSGLKFFFFLFNSLCLNPNHHRFTVSKGWFRRVFLEVLDGLKEELKVSEEEIEERASEEEKECERFVVLCFFLFFWFVFLFEV